MLTLDLARLDRERGSVRVHEVVAKDDPLLEDAELELRDGLEVDVEVRRLPSGEIVVRGGISAILDRECRRCLEPLEIPLEEEVDILFVPEDGTGEEEESVDDVGVQRFSEAAGVLELGEAIRAEAILAAPRYVECSEDCRGLCPKCGINLNEETCDCTRSEPDPRWEKLRALKEE